jgi:hypothetical protein
VLIEQEASQKISVSVRFYGRYIRKKRRGTSRMNENVVIEKLPKFFESASDLSLLSTIYSLNNENTMKNTREPKN